MTKPKRPQRAKPIRIEAAELVQNAILSGHLRPGEEVPQLKLSRKLGLSQASLREALQELEHRGLLLRKGRTRVIIDLSEDDLAKMFQLRGILEPVACRLAASHWNDKISDQLEAGLALMEDAARQGNYREHLRLDLEFHRHIWLNQPNQYLARQLEMICFPLFAFELVQRSEFGYLNFERTIRQHRFILSLLQSRDENRVERLVRRLIDRFHRLDLADYRAFRKRASNVSSSGAWS